ncbi:hypothetical protein [Paenibacillus glycanilyticus]|uniref:Uncharacterized protein n=1 Tax=Paenibacillus glycanilyticus TaxID=126569 RepID=A0ABQ6GC06_9BACL|nr:hypothetical protein [Paenibacillus glycanilyticus]GLX66798.1 hypothetical protein MU1_11420 [Paenibacillus glycanilyticus]
MFNCIGKVIIINNNGIIHFGFAKQIAPESIQVGNGNGSTTSEVELEETGRETESQAIGNGVKSSVNGRASTGKSKGAKSKSKGKQTVKTPAAAKKQTAQAAPAASNQPLGKSPFENFGRNHPLHKMLKGFK